MFDLKSSPLKLKLDPAECGNFGRKSQKKCGFFELQLEKIRLAAGPNSGVSPAPALRAGYRRERSRSSLFWRICHGLCALLFTVFTMKSPYNLMSTSFFLQIIVIHACPDLDITCGALETGQNISNSKNFRFWFVANGEPVLAKHQFWKSSFPALDGVCEVKLSMSRLFVTHRNQN